MTEHDVVPPVEPGTMTVSEVTSLVTLFNGMLLAMEGRLARKIEDMAQVSRDRWARHDLDLDRERALMLARFERIEKVVNDHISQEHEEEIILEARVRPVKNVFSYLAKNWRTVLLIIVSVLALIDVSAMDLAKWADLVK